MSHFDCQWTNSFKFMRAMEKMVHFLQKCYGKRDLFLVSFWVNDMFFWVWD